MNTWSGRGKDVLSAQIIVSYDKTKAFREHYLCAVKRKKIKKKKAIKDKRRDFVKVTLLQGSCSVRLDTGLRPF